MSNLSIPDARHDLERQSQIRKGMEPKLYHGALSGCVEEVYQFNWVEHRTLIGNNVLHMHVGKRVHIHTNKALQDTVSVEFICAVMNDEAGYCLLWKQNANGDTPLHLAARFRRKESVQELMKQAKGSNQGELKRLLSITNRNKDTALHEAARVGQAGMIKLLVDACALEHQPNEVGETPLYLAAESGSDETVGNILNYGAPSLLALNHKGPCGRTALHAAVQRGRPAMVQEMMKADVSMILVQDDQGSTPLHLAAVRRMNLKVLKVLLGYDNENASAVYIQDNEGKTTLHVATLQCNWNGVKELVSSCPDSIEIVDDKGQNVVHYATNLGCVCKLKALLDLGCFDKAY